MFEYGFAINFPSGDVYAVAWNEAGRIVAANDDATDSQERIEQPDASQWQMDADPEMLAWLNSQNLSRYEQD